MKKFLALILAVWMLLSCAVTAFAVNSDLEFDVLLGIKEYITDIEKKDVVVKEQYGTMTFVWTPQEDANMVFSLVETSVEGMTFTVEQDEQIVESVNGNVSVHVSSGVAVTIVVTTGGDIAGKAVLCGKKVVGGDVSGDGKVDTLDGLLLMQYLNGWNVNISNPDAMDVNKDGKVDSLDGLLMMRYLNGWDVTLK